MSADQAEETSAARPGGEARSTVSGGGNCAELYQLLDAYVDGELSDGECEQLKSHLVECPSCLSEYERDALLKALVRRSCQCEEAPSTLRAQILTRISTFATDGQTFRATTVTTVTDIE